MKAEDHPRMQLELELRFSTEQACRQYLFDLVYAIASRPIGSK